MTHGRRRTGGPGRRARKALAWGAAWLLGLQLATAAWLEWKRPEFYDPKYGCRLTRLRARLAQTPGRTLAVVLGSSRAEQGFRPGLLAGEGGPSAPVFFNLSRGGSSPLLHLVTLRRLLADGVRPDWVLLEIFPPSLAEDEAGATLPKTTLRDFPLLDRHAVAWKTYVYFLRDRLLLWHRYRSGLLAWAPAWLSGGAGWEERLWDARGGEWRAVSEGATPQERRNLTADARRRYYRKLQAFRIAPGADRALRELLGLCRERGIGVVLLLMPEASEFRGWYPPLARERLAEYLAALCREYGTAVIDARRWVPDGEFYDGHHLLLAGAAAFTRRLEAEVLSPLLRGTAIHSLAGGPPETKSSR